MILVSFIFYGCATIVSPSGGPKDNHPPKIVKSIPVDHSVNFHSDNIRIYFNKFVKLNNINTNALVSPPMTKAPDYTIKGKSLVIKLKEHPKDSTTYTISLDNSIADIRENNIVTDMQYVFSTGNHLDSLQIEGRVLDAFTLKPIKDVLVMLYLKNKDSVPYKERPLNIARTDAKGRFFIKNLKKATYKIFVLKDVNNNYLYDQPNEQIAFIDTTLVPVRRDTSKKDTINILKHTLNLFQENDSIQKLIKYWVVSMHQAQIIFKYPVRKLSLLPVSKFKLPTANSMLPGSITELSKTRDTLNIWFVNYNKDSISFSVRNNNKIVDTVKLYLAQKKYAKKGEKLGLRFNVAKANPFDLFKPIRFTSNTPLKDYDIKKIKLIDGKDTVQPSVSFADSVKRKMELSYHFLESHTYTLFIKPNAFKDVYDITNDTIKIDFKTQALKNYGSLKIIPKFSEYSIPKILQLLNASGNVVRETVIRSKADLQFEHISPATFTLRLIYDANNNGRWDTGKYLKHIQPEKVVIYHKPVVVRANWDTEIEWGD